MHDAETAQDNTYTGKAAVFTDDEESWSNYSLDLELTVKDGVIESLNYGSVGSENASYVKRAMKGTSKGTAGDISDGGNTGCGVRSYLYGIRSKRSIKVHDGRSSEGGRRG